MIYFNGETGGIGRHLAHRLRDLAIPSRSLTTRIEKAIGLTEELDAGDPPKPGSSIVLVHLAALVSVPLCEEEPARARLINVDGAVDYVRGFAEWSLQHGYSPSLVYVSTGHVYAPSPPGTRLVETDPTEPGSVYARTKREGEVALTKLADEMGFPISIARVFGLLAPGQPSHYVLPGLINRVERGDVAGIPGLDNVRDYLDARDVVRHLHRLADLIRSGGVPGWVIVNVCSGEGIRIRELLEAVAAEIHRDDLVRAEAIMTAATAAPGRPTDITWLVGSPARLEEITSEPGRTIPLETTVRDAVAAH